MGILPSTRYTGELFDNNTAAVGPLSEDIIAAMWCFCSSDEYHSAVKRIDRKRNVTNATLVKVPFDLERWQKVAAERYPNGLPQPYSNDPTQWIFHGHPCALVVWDETTKRTAHGPSRVDAYVLQVAVARLLGYRWPAEYDTDMELADEQRALVARSQALHSFEDHDGVVCLPPVRGERPAHDRLLGLLHAAYGDDWHDGIRTALLNEVGGRSLDDWLRNWFFQEHCKLFFHRPFVWHVWDGRKHDGFHALVNYHKLAEGDGKGRRLLQSLTYSYLGDWIDVQQRGVKRGDSGAEGRLNAALELKARLEKILEGEPPFDLFIRWRPLAEQPIGWDPYIDDGVRLNIRPFMADDIPGGRKEAGVLRVKPNVKWGNDRGKEPELSSETGLPLRDPEQFPWFYQDGRYTARRVNDVHLTIEQKRSVRAQESYD